MHLTHLNPFPANFGEVLKSFDTVLVPEMNKGQLSRMIRSDFLVDAKAITKVMGIPFTANELEAEIKEAFND